MLPLYVFNGSSGRIITELDLPFVIISSVLMTDLFYKALILQGEISSLSLLGLKGLTTVEQIANSRLQVFLINT